MKATVELLRAMPDLAAEVAITARIGAPNPTESARTRPGKPGSRPPLDLEAMHACWDGDRGLLAELADIRLAICRTSSAALPDPLETSNWTEETDWLLSAVHAWQADPELRQYVAQEVNYIHSTLARLARTQPEPVYLCDKCGNRAHPQPGGEWMRCEEGHQVMGLGAARKRLQDAQPMTAAQLQQDYGIRPGDIRRWKAEGIIKPTGQLKPQGRGRPADLWSVYDVLQAERGGVVPNMAS